MLALLPAVRRAAEREQEDAACIGALERGVWRMLRCAENLSAWEQLNAVPPLPQTFSLRAAVQESLRCAAAVLGDGAALHCDACREALPVRADARLLGCALGNLLANAVRFSAGGARVHVACARRAGAAVVTVRDEGAGMRPALLGQAFAPWVSADPYGDGAPPPGLGLGLAVAQRFAAAYGGRLALESTFGGGTCATLALPLAADDGAPAARSGAGGTARTDADGTPADPAAGNTAYRAAGGAFDDSTSVGGAVADRAPVGGAFSGKAPTGSTFSGKTPAAGAAGSAPPQHEADGRSPVPRVGLAGGAACALPDTEPAAALCAGAAYTQLAGLAGTRL